MKPLPVLTLSLALAASFPASASSLMFDFGNPVPNTGTPQGTSTTPGPVATGTYLTLSPGHATGSVPATETTWNTITASTPRSDLKYSDGSNAAATVTLTLGQEAVNGNNVIDYGTAISNLALVGSGGAAANQQSLLTPGSIYGDSRLGSSAVGRDGFFGANAAAGVPNAPGAAIGFRVDGLAEGNYTVYLMGRNTNSNAAGAGGMMFYWEAGSPSGTFAFSSANAEFQTNTSYASAGYSGQYSSFAAGENHVAFDVTITAGQSLFVAVDGGAVERGFLNMAQITPATVVPTSFVWSKGDGDWDTASLNWNSDFESYAEPALVTFPTLIDGVDGINTVNLTAAFSPSTVNITNTGDFDTTAYAFTGTGSINGSTGVTKNGSGLARFSNESNSYSGILTINTGAVIKEVADSTTGDIGVSSGATLALTNGITDGSGQTVTITGAGQTNQNYFYEGSLNQRGAIQSLAGSNTWAGDIVLLGATGTGGNTRIGVQNGSSLTLTGTISEAVAGISPYFRAGDSPSDVITLAGTCSWTGPTRIYSNGGVVTISDHDKLPTVASLIVGASGGVTGSPTFDLAGFNQSVAGLSGTSGTYAPIIKNTGVVQSTLTLNPSETISFPGIIQDDVKLVIGGTGTQTLTGDNTHVADTIINDGAALIVGDGGELQFYPAANGVTNSVGGEGTLVYDGSLRIATIGADATPGNSWVLVNVGSLLDADFGATFAVVSEAGAFSETEVDSGIWKKDVGGVEWTFTESDGTLSVAVGSAQPFDTWIETYFPDSDLPEIVGKDADPDGDGYDNLAEFALNGNPDDGADNGYHVVAVEDTNADTQKELTLTLAVRKAGGSPVFSGSPLSATVDGVTYTIEGALDLVFPGSATSEAAPATGPDGLHADYEYRRFRLDASEGLTGKGFLRVKTEPATP